MSTSNRWITGFNYFMMILFLLAAGFQYNDFDATAWIITYSTAALACILWRWTSISRFLFALLSLVCAVWALYLLIIHGDQLSWDGMFNSIQMQNNSIEIIREAGGLFIISCWSAVLFWNPRQ
ncbi:transmembrane 220 family protein [Fodinibius salsisoli]|uniref:Transmembrane 220 family protein n=1 Tax=Fodinibius salsisoli TaxID=2820877 RepID=A0ABT3PP56_9BACT|nr:transmembrane 220 family protein [Fodinibius salsisoli]MCW9707641.1 transmembrane 220 family protein [Fodinibius salsisoli]